MEKQQTNTSTSRKFSRIIPGREAQRIFIDRQFALLWSSQTISSVGSYITSIGLPIAALLLLHATPAQMGLLAALGALPGLFIGLYMGVWIDRLPRRLVMIVADLGRALLLGLISLAAISGLLRLDWLYAAAALAGLLNLCFEVANLSFLPTLLHEDQLAAGNSRLGVSNSLAEIGGPPLAGFLIQLLTAPVAILVDACSFLASALLVGLIRVSERPRAETSEPRRVGQEVREGLTALVQEPVLRALAAYLCTFNFFGGAYAALYLLYTVQLFGSNVFAYSIFVAAGGVGALGGSLCAHFFARRFGSRRVLIVSAAFYGVLSFCTPCAGGPKLLVFLVLAGSQLIGDTGVAVYSINEISLRQVLVPGHLLGRINACMYILANSLLPLGALLAGWLSELIGVRLTLLVGSSGLALASLWLLFSPLRQDRSANQNRL